MTGKYKVVLTHRDGLMATLPFVYDLKEAKLVAKRALGSKVGNEQMVIRSDVVRKTYYRTQTDVTNVYSTYYDVGRL